MRKQGNELSKRNHTGMTSCEIAIIGAGPYGLSIAAHLRAGGLEPLVFGRVMSFWKQSMPEGMLLRSPWEGSHIGDPSRGLTLDHFGASVRTRRQEPIPLEFFVRYGEWFQRAAVPDVDSRSVDRIESVPSGFALSLEDGETVRARRVVVATGLAGHEHRPPQFVGLPSELATHASEHSSFKRLAGKRVAVIGAGQSALESAALLLESGAAVDVIARTNVIHWIGARPGIQTSWNRMQALVKRVSAPAQIGPFPLNWIVEAPDLVRLLPAQIKRSIYRRALRPAGASWLMPRTEQLRIRTSRVVISAVEGGTGVRLKLDDCSEVLVDHVLLATGYRPDITRYSFLPPELVSKMASSDRYPVLSGGLETSIPGLYFAGAAAVPSLGPLMRFVAGSNAAGRRIAAHVGRRVRRDRELPKRVFLAPRVGNETVASASIGEREMPSLTSVPSGLKEFND